MSNKQHNVVLSYIFYMRRISTYIKFTFNTSPQFLIAIHWFPKIWCIAYCNDIISPSSPCETRLFQILLVWFPTTRDRYFDGASVSHCGRKTCVCSADNYSRRRHPKISVMSLSRWNKGHGLLQVLLYTTASRIEG